MKSALLWGALFACSLTAGAQTVEGVAASQTAPLYLADTTMEITCTFTFPAERQLYSLLWVPSLPEGWRLVGVAGEGVPEIDAEGGVTFLGALGGSPHTFTYTVSVPVGAAGPETLGATVEYQLNDMFNPEPFTVAPVTLAEVEMTHTAVGYLAGERMAVSCTVSCRQERQLQSLLWTPELPEGWSLVEVSGEGTPQLDPGGASIAFVGFDLADYRPLRFSYTVQVPAGTVGLQPLRGQAEYQLDGMFNPLTVPATPDPLIVQPMHRLTVASAYGVTEPVAGDYIHYHDTILTNRVTGPREMIGSQSFVCAGWRLAGNEPLSGSGTDCLLTLTNNAALTWVWTVPRISPAGTVAVVMDEDQAPVPWAAPAVSAVETSVPEGWPEGLLTWSLETPAVHGVASVGGTGPTPALAYAPQANGYGEDSFTVKVTDAAGGEDRITVQVTVRPVNDAPVLATIGDQRTDERTTLTFTAAATDVDVPAQLLTYSLDSTSRAAGMSIDPVSGVFTWTPTEGQAGADFASFPVTVTVTDNGTGPDNQSDSETFTVTLDSSRATHATVGYVNGQPLTLTCTFAYPATTGRQLQSLLWRPELPVGWTLVSAAGDGTPDVDLSDGSVVFLGGDLPSHNPVTFSYVVAVPAGATGPQPVRGLVEYQLDGMANPATVRAQPDPLIVPMLVSLPELQVSDKVYDGLTNATVTAYGALSGVVPGHDVQLVTTGAWSYFGTPDAGSNKVVTVGGLALTGADAAGYAIDVQTVTAAVAKAALTITGSLTAANKTYDGTTAAAIIENALTLVTPVGGDDVVLVSVAVFDTKDVGAGKAVTLSATSSLSGADAGNYTLSIEGAPAATADILMPTVSGTQTCNGFRSPSSATVISGTFTIPDGASLTALVWKPELPVGWTLLSASGVGTQAVNGDGEIVFVGPFDQQTVAFTYAVAIPGDEKVTNYLSAAVTFRLMGMSDSLTADRLPGTLLLKRYHSADYRAPFWKIDIFELQRMKGYLNSPAYHPDTLTVDGFNFGAGSTEGGRHAADYRLPFWKVDPLEYGKVKGYFNAGNYHVAPATLDGYAEGP